DVDRQLFAAAGEAAADAKVRLAPYDRQGEFRDVGRVVRAVGIHENDNIGIRELQALPHRRSLASAVIGVNRRTEALRDRPRLVGGAPVHDMNFVRERRRSLNRLGDRVRFIAGEDHHRDAGIAVDDEIEGCHASSAVDKGADSTLRAWFGSGMRVQGRMIPRGPWPYNPRWSASPVDLGGASTDG